ncbi:MAG TPA: DUF1573 domain-containing protein [candidate division Zixibacteria bacterium]|nr:DUF1573 domain-containing protein [candidate division Zixibacteria bacterium]
MSKKKRREGKEGVRESADKTRSEMHPQNRKRSYILLLGVLIVAIGAVAILSNGFSGLTNESANAAEDRSSETETYADQSASGSSQGPSIYFPEESYDFGTISQKTQVSHTFIVKNTGSAPLKLIKAKGS